MNRTNLYVVIFVVAGGWYYYTQHLVGETYGPAPTEELLKMDLSKATKVIVIAENKDIEQEPNGVKVGFVWGTHKGFQIFGYDGDIEIRDHSGNVIGGVKNGNRWVK